MQGLNPLINKGLLDSKSLQTLINKGKVIEKKLYSLNMTLTYSGLFRPSGPSTHQI